MKQALAPDPSGAGRRADAMPSSCPIATFHRTMILSAASMHVPQQAGKTAIRAMAGNLGRLVLCAAVFLLSTVGRQGAGSARAQAAFAQGNSVELDEILFVQAPEHDNGSGGIEVEWIPEPLQKFCLGKTMSQCSAMDFCIRTTSKQISMCKNLAIPLSRLPSYPPGMTPRRMMSLGFYKLAPGGPYQRLEDFYKSLPRSALTRISMTARVKARIRFTRGQNDDDFQLEQVLAVAPF